MAGGGPARKQLCFVISGGHRLPDRCLFEGHEGDVKKSARVIQFIQLRGDPLRVDCGRRAGLIIGFAKAGSNLEIAPHVLPDPGRERPRLHGIPAPLGDGVFGDPEGRYDAFGKTAVRVAPVKKPGKQEQGR